jgi:hypothetical protein
MKCIGIWPYQFETGVSRLYQFETGVPRLYQFETDLVLKQYQRSIKIISDRGQEAAQETPDPA